ncbi:MAG TPA: ATP-binding protein [Syntrophaceae bacterium]|nr:ATP-binding protein [Syntrophaceae bacterium]
MNAFHTIAIPHKDILEGRLTMDVFAADLWEVSQKRGPDEYKDPETFFRKTYLTQGLENLLTIVKKRLHGEGGDPVIQIQTPFGGGKTHALIAMYHKAEEWCAKKVVVVGTALGTEETLWGLMEKQLTGKLARFTGQVSPGKDAIRELLYENQPVLILMDEVLEYVTKAAGVKVEESTLAAQTIAFMQELTETSGTLEKVCLVVTLPSSIIEHYDEGTEKLYQQLQKVTGRVEKIYTPVQENEITKIIRRRIFGQINEYEAKKVVAEFMEYAEKEGVIPAGLLPSEYRNRLLESYPFMPEVVDVLYHRWGSFPTFQRTRGVLRLLSLVVHSLKGINKPYISLADFDLANQEIRQELLKHIGAEYNSVIAADITDIGAGSKKVDVSLGSAYQGLNLGTRTATTIFLYSFSGGHEQGTTLGEIKRCATTIENPASVVAEAAEQLKGKLFYLQNIGEKYFFSNQPNINRILQTYIVNIKESELAEMEQEILKKRVKGGKLKVFIWEENAGNIPDSEELKLVILKIENKEIMENILKNKGQTPRVYRNTLFFLYPLESERLGFINTLKHKIAYKYIEHDKNLCLSDDQKKEIKKELKKTEEDLKESIRRFYRIVAVPDQEEFKEVDLGIPTYGEEMGLDQEVYEKLRSDGEILEKIAPIVLREKYLSDREYVSTEQLYQSSLKTPGETRPTDKTVLEQGIAEGVRMGLFGLGELEDYKPICRYFKEQASIAFSGNEVIISEALCCEQKNKEETPELMPPSQSQLGYELPPTIGMESEKEDHGPQVKSKDKIHLRFRVPKGKVASIMGVMNLLQSKFETLEIELTAKEGGISEQDYEDKIKEAFRQMDIELDEE